MLPYYVTVSVELIRCITSLNRFLISTNLRCMSRNGEHNFRLKFVGDVWQGISLETTLLSTKSVENVVLKVILVKQMFVINS